MPSWPRRGRGGAPAGRGRPAGARALEVGALAVDQRALALDLRAIALELRAQAIELGGGGGELADPALQVGGPALDLAVPDRELGAPAIERRAIALDLSRAPARRRGPARAAARPRATGDRAGPAAEHHGEVADVGRHRHRLGGQLGEHPGALGQLAVAVASAQHQREHRRGRVVVEHRHVDDRAGAVGPDDGVERARRVVVLEPHRELGIGERVDADVDGRDAQLARGRGELDDARARGPQGSTVGVLRRRT